MSRMGTKNALKVTGQPTIMDLLERGFVCYCSVCEKPFAEVRDYCSKCGEPVADLLTGKLITAREDDPYRTIELDDIQYKAKRTGRPARGAYERF